ncbi:MAG: branched-chain amino acid ABC transporter permease [Haloarculaceae archaeon]
MSDLRTLLGVGEDHPLYRYRIPVGLLVLVVGLRPVVAHEWFAGYGQLATSMLIWMVFVASFNLLFGYTGLLSFGHAMFLGIGMYVVAIGVSVFALPWLVAAVAGVLVAGTVGYAIGRIIAGKGEIYFAMLTLAFAQAAYFVVNADPYGLTGGSSGLTQGTLPTWIETYRGQKRVVLAGMQGEWYWLVALVFLVTMLALWQVVRSPFGRTLMAVRDNRQLAKSIGIDTDRYQTAAFTLSTMFAAVAGALMEINSQGASLETFAINTSGDTVLMAVLGGVNYFFGPITGVFVWLFAEDYLTSFETLHLPLAEFSTVSVDLSGLLNYWAFALGALFVLVVLVSPKDGIWGFVRGLTERVAARLREVTR